MKFILEYNSYNTDSITEQIKDILADLADDGFKINIYPYKKGQEIEVRGDHGFLIHPLKIEIHYPINSNCTERSFSNCVEQLKIFMNQQGYPFYHTTFGYSTQLSSIGPAGLVRIIYFSKTKNTKI